MNGNNNLGQITFENVQIPKKQRDFAGEKWGPNNKQFSIIITDPEVQQKLMNLGVNVFISEYSQKDEPPRGYVNCKLDFRFNDIKIAVVTSDNHVSVLNENTVNTLNDAWIKSADAVCTLRSYKTATRSGVTVYCKTLIVHLMSQEDRDEYFANRPAYSDELRSKYAGYFNN